MLLVETFSGHCKPRESSLTALQQAAALGPGLGPPHGEAAAGIHPAEEQAAGRMGWPG